MNLARRLLALLLMLGTALALPLPVEAQVRSKPLRGSASRGPITTSRLNTCCSSSWRRQGAISFASYTIAESMWPG